ncbi:hypothetical protein JYU34_010352 [Plutella xylostella]|uniref:Uncharacterized protein n=1 Tax=Plutella xylostella TaxID=51655 RepID=A0ABQ7QI89_PLUXY|nr:hypothetical protein JYU34_010352 [Plutella xylostella]
MLFSAFFLLFVCSLTPSIYASSENVKESGETMGVDTVHFIKTDKDTVITSLKTDTGKNQKAARHHKSEGSDGSYNAIPPEVAPHALAFKKNMSECLKEVQASDTRTVKRLSPSKHSPIHGECLIACVLKRNGVIENGKVNKGNLIALVNKFYAKNTKVMKKLDKNLDRCINASVQVRDECSMAELLNQCTNELMANNKHKLTVDY